MNQEIREYLENAIQFASDNLDLSRCKYRPEQKPSSSPGNYYSFLAGFCAQLDISKVLEIGSFNGGAIFAMCEGVRHCSPARSNQLATIDITDLNRTAYIPYPEINKVVGDCFSPQVISKVERQFPDGGDLLFIDAVHRYKHTRWCVEEFSRIFRPKFIFLDDIFINEWMQKLWEELREFLPEQCIDLTSIANRSPDCGFGLLLSNRQEIKFPEPIRDGTGPYDAFRR